MQRSGKRNGVQGGVGRFRSISVRLTAFALVISIFPLMLVSMLLMKQMEKMTEHELNQSYQWIVSEHLVSVRDKLSRYETSLEYITRNKTIQESLLRGTSGPYTLGNEITEEVFKMMPMENQREVYNCIVHATGPVAAYGTSVKVFTDIDRKMWQDKGWQGGETFFVDELWSGESLLSLVKPIRYVDVDAFTEQEVGLVRLDLYLEGIFRPSGSDDGKYRLILTDASGECVYASDKALSEADNTQNMDNFAVMEAELPEYGMRLTYLFDNNELTRQKADIRRSIYTMALLISLLVILLAKVYFTGFSRRVGQLIEKFRIAGSGDRSPMPPVAGQDEIALLDKKFGQMLQNMDEMNRRSEEQQNTIREAKYRNLQLQINPHFLYNTLETISAIGAIHGVMQVCDLCEKLGDIFRYSLGKNEGKYTTVARELKQIQNYIFIQQARHKFDVFYSVDVEDEEVYMLRFLLQPIVENAVMHGLNKESRVGTLEVCVSERDGDLEISISDDGAGMTEERLEALRRSLEESSDRRENVSNIGVWNIAQRIRLSHGEPYGISVTSRPGAGSKFILRLPMITKGMIENDEIPTADR